VVLEVLSNVSDEQIIPIFTLKEMVNNRYIDKNVELHTLPNKNEGQFLVKSSGL
jgi:hypothetical protein